MTGAHYTPRAPRGIDRTRSRIVQLRRDADDYAVHHDYARCLITGTPQVFRGTLDECIAWKRGRI